MFDEKEIGKNVDRLSHQLYEIDIKFEQEKKNEKRKIIHSYIENFLDFDTEILSSGVSLHG